MNRRRAVTEGYKYAALIVAPLPKGEPARDRVTEGYEYAEQLVFYNIIFAFNTSYPPLGSQARASLLAAINVNIAARSPPALCECARSSRCGTHSGYPLCYEMPCSSSFTARGKGRCPHAMDKGYCAHLRQEGKAITNAHATKKPLPAGRGGRRMRSRFFTFSCPCRGRARPASPLRPALFYRRRRKCHRDRRSPSCRTCRARVRHAPVRAT